MRSRLERIGLPDRVLKLLISAMLQGCAGDVLPCTYAFPLFPAVTLHHYFPGTPCTLTPWLMLIFPSENIFL